MPEPRRLLGADGRVVSVDDLPDSGGVVAHVAEVPLVPVEIHGFAIDHFMTVYPIDATDSHRRAYYVNLRPISEDAQRLMTAKNRDVLQASTPLTPAGAQRLRDHPDGTLAERVVFDTLRAAVQELRRWIQVPRQPFERRN